MAAFVQPIIQGLTTLKQYQQQTAAAQEQAKLEAARSQVLSEAQQNFRNALVASAIQKLMQGGKS